MKTVIKTLAVLGMTLGMVGVAAAKSEFVATDDSVTTKICIAAASGKKLNLHKEIKSSGLSKRYIEKKVTCNGMPIIDFVEEHSGNPIAMNFYITNGKYNVDEGYVANASR